MDNKNYRDRFPRLLDEWSLELLLETVIKHSARLCFDDDDDGDGDGSGRKYVSSWELEPEVSDSLGIPPHRQTGQSPLTSIRCSSVTHIHQVTIISWSIRKCAQVFYKWNDFC